MAILNQISALKEKNWSNLKKQTFAMVHNETVKKVNQKILSFLYV
jgi:hypothetical protein